MTTLKFFQTLNGPQYFDHGYLSRTNFQEIAVSPCETCHNKEKCRSQLLACSYYATWMNSRVPNKKHSRVPNAMTYERIFGKRIVVKKKELANV